ncbi:starch-binding protein [Bacteroidia bacterium]|nr:starch-binding protein [Bacteroidia bacterium]
MKSTSKSPYTQGHKKYRSQLVLLFTCCLLASCSDYLTIVPDDIPTIDHAFSNRASTEKFLFTCYSYLPNPADAFSSSGPAQSRECWVSPSGGMNWYWINGDNTGKNLYTWRIAKGEQTTNDPILNYWDGKNGGTALFTAIRDCNIFLENIDKPTGIMSSEKERWIAEVKFLKAYFHFLLLRQYGPIPIIRENIPIGSSPDVVRVYRDPVEDVAAYIVSLLDDAADVLSPALDGGETEEMGRATKATVLAVKAQLLTMMASPLFNGNPYIRNYADKRGTLLFPQEADPRKWETAKTAIKAAIDCAELESYSRLFTYVSELPISSDIVQEMSLRGAVTERWNREIIWGSVKSDERLQALANVGTGAITVLVTGFSSLAPTMEQAELFYTKNGLPITEDREYTGLYPNIYATSVASEKDADYIRPGFETANLNFDREPRFYSSMTFDGGYFFGNSNSSRDVSMKLGDYGGGISERYSVTGYLPKKLVNRETTLSTSSWTCHWYSYPFIRLADLYLMYAEALNEVKAAPDNEVYEYIDKVRERAGLKGVRETWTSAPSLHPEYITNKGRMRDIIHRERLIELAFENAPCWDILRWMEAETRWNKYIKGWNIYGGDAADYYQIRTVAASKFVYRDYFTPISQEALDRNPNLVQNPGW